MGNASLASELWALMRGGAGRNRGSCRSLAVVFQVGALVISRVVGAGALHLYQLINTIV